MDDTNKGPLDAVGELCALGLQEQGAKRYDEAANAYRQALTYDSNCITALNNLATLLSDKANWEVAETLFRRCIKLRPDHSNYVTNLATTLLRKEDYPEAEQACWEAIKLNEGDWVAYRNLGLCAYHTGQSKAAAEYFTKSAELNPGDKGVEADLSMALMSMGEINQGFKQFKSRWQLVGKRQIFRSAMPMFIGGDLTDKSIIVHHEQGYGDTLHFARFIPWLRTKFNAAYIIFAGPANLQRLMIDSGMIDEYVLFSRNDSINAHADYHIPLVNILSLFELDYSTIPVNIPYFKRTEQTGPKIKKHIDIGLCWCGSGAYRLDFMKSIPIKETLPLLELPNVRLHSLVIGPRESEIDDAGMAGLVLKDYTDRITDFADTAQFMSELDLIVTIDSAVAHLAGALGYPTLMLLSYSYCWRWLRGRSDTPWYPSIRMMAQAKPGEWAPVIQQVKDFIEAKFS